VARSEDRNAGRACCRHRVAKCYAGPGGRCDFFRAARSPPAITGITALLLARQAGLDVGRTRQVLRAATDTVVTAEGEMRSVNACRALAELVGNTHCGS
jgi:hypothetical protein